MSQQVRGKQAAKAKSVFAVVGVLADVAAVVALFFETGYKIVLVAASLSILVGVYLLVRAWGKPLGGRAIAAFLCVAVGLVVIGISVASALYPAILATPSPPADPTRRDDGGTSTQKPAPAAREATSFEGQVRLTPRTGVDLEAGQKQGVDVDGPNGAIDLYLDEYGVLNANGGTFYADDGPESDAKSRCVKSTTSQRDPTTVLPSSAGPQYCFRTSGKRVAWFRINDTVSVFAGQRSSAYTVLNVRVWAE